MVEPVTTAIKGKIAWVSIDHPPVNATSTSVRAGLMAAVSAVQGCDLAVLQCIGKTFIAGGDMSEFDRPPEPPHLPDVVNAIENSETPFLALLHGNVLGGGFEIAMACAYRIAKPGTRFGLPEVNVGLIPGAGGTLRAPRLLGWDMAVNMACFGSMHSAEELHKLGAVDEISNDLTKSVEAFQRPAVVKVSEQEVEPLAPEQSMSIEAKIKKISRGRQSQQQNFIALQRAMEPYADAQPKERAQHLELRQSSESIGLRHIFFAERLAVKPSVIKGITGAEIKHIAIVGGGLMGCGIATSCLNAGSSVNLIEQNNESANFAKATVTDLLQAAVKRGIINSEQMSARLSRFSVGCDYAKAASADLAIEAIYENLAAKQQVFKQLDALVSHDALLATNTSYLDPNKIFSDVSNPERCLGLHFFSPAHIMKLVEVVQAEYTSSKSLSTVFSYAKTLRKTPVLSGICDGFIGNRILSAYRRAAEYLLADGALPQDIDQAMREFGMAMGPFEVQDLSGLQIAESNRRRLDATRDASERYVNIADRLCAMERYGQRSGLGWYKYEADSRTPIVDESVNNLITNYSKEHDIKRVELSSSQLCNRLLAAMANEGARIVEEGIAESDQVVDVVKVHGYGFPRWKGGPMNWALEVGTDSVQQCLTELELASPNSWVRAKRFAS